MALVEQVSYIEESQIRTEVTPDFKLFDLAKQYQTSLQERTGSIPDRMYSTRVKISFP